MHAVYIENLNKSYGATPVLKGINLAIEPGEFYALMGPNGSGKSTLASVLASVVKFDSGIVEIYGRRPEQARRWIGYIPQDNFSVPQLTGRENLYYFAGLSGYSGAKARQIVEDMLDKMGLSAEANKKASQYSGGMRKRLELATTLLPEIRILILDEPTTGLDPTARRDFFSLINAIKDQAASIILITHTGTDAELADRVGLIDQGRFIAEDTPLSLRANFASEDLITFETITKSDRVADLIRKYSLSQKIADTGNGYKIYAHNGEKLVPQITQILNQSGFRVIRTEVTKPTLEDVFFKLTQKIIQEVN